MLHRLSMLPCHSLLLRLHQLFHGWLLGLEATNEAAEERLTLATELRSRPAVCNPAMPLRQPEAVLMQERRRHEVEPPPPMTAAWESEAQKARSQTEEAVDGGCGAALATPLEKAPAAK
mmetsp:Transcript_328/g.944  ORF Transcript_328/g.944 Transcript_328/m.944 type:complete len:119 (-) Transcript_328:13-369(-)